MTWPWTNNPSTASTPPTPAQMDRIVAQLAAIQLQQQWVISALLMIAPQLETALPLPQVPRATRPLPPNYRKRTAADVWQAQDRRAEDEGEASRPALMPQPQPQPQAPPSSPNPTPIPKTTPTDNA